MLFGLLMVNDQLGVPRKSSLDVPSMRMTPRCSSGSMSVVISRREAQSRNRGVNEAQATWRELEKDIIHKFTTYNPWFKQNLVPLPLLWRAWESKDFATSKEWSKGNCYLLNPFKLHELLNETSRLVRFHEYLTPARTIARAGTPPYTERATRRAISARLIPDLRYNWTGSDSLDASRILIKKFRQRSESSVHIGRTS